ncbi:VAN3-binding protein-like isoform X2 [Zingiber officinale]|uniref:VAN3-binding protein-like isoform X2 n=1 Tax=Zingiber officinale TaxID=94328 RepID=UPI001C4AB6BC|nr:VAN3-binding protein-like isoform X2 [Zingiber officinale]
MDDARPRWETGGIRLPELPKDPMDFLSRSWSPSALEVSKALAPMHPLPTMQETIPEEEDEEFSPAISGNPFSFASSVTSQMVLERIMSQLEVSPLASGRLSHSSGPLNGGGSLSDSPPVSPCEMDELKSRQGSNTPKPQNYRVTSKTVGRWLKDRRERKKEETRAQNAQLHAAVSVAGVAATLVAAQCVEAAELMGAEREHLTSVVGSAVNVRTPGDIVTLTAAAATALRGAATLKARALKDVWNIAAVIPVEKGTLCNHNHQRQSIRQKELDSNGRDFNDELIPVEDNFFGICSQEFLAKGTDLLKRTRKGALHWKIVSVYINRLEQVMLKMKSRHVAGTITKKKKSVIIDVCKDIQAWPGRHLLEVGEQRRYFGLRTTEHRIIEFECLSKRDHEMWTQGVAHLLSIVNEKKNII